MRQYQTLPHFIKKAGILDKEKDNQATIHNPEKLGKKEDPKRDNKGGPQEGEVVKIRRAQVDFLV